MINRRVISYVFFSPLMFQMKKGRKDTESIETRRKEQRRKMANEERERGSDWRKETREILSISPSAILQSKDVPFPHRSTRGAIRLAENTPVFFTRERMIEYDHRYTCSCPKYEKDDSEEETGKKSNRRRTAWFRAVSLSLSFAWLILIYLIG